MRLLAIYLSPGHNYFGHHGKPAGTHPVISVPEAECVAGMGLRGDRFFGHKTDYRGQVTFFDAEVFAGLRSLFPAVSPAVSPAVLRRNLLVRDTDLNSLIGSEFELQGVRFEGVAECSPCHWMDQAFHPGTEQALRNRGGLRARILTPGLLRAEGWPSLSSPPPP